LKGGKYLFDKDNALYKVLTFAEASEKWNLNDSTLRKAVKTDRLIEGLDYRKSGKVWLIRVETMEKLYGKLEEK
jgi:hypothetical protein